MFGFGRREVERDTVASLALKLDKVSAELLATQSALRTLETEQIEMHDQVRKWMRRAVAAERNQVRAATDSPVTPAPATAPPAWGALGRIRARGRVTAPAPDQPPAEDTVEGGSVNGVHP